MLEFVVVFVKELNKKYNIGIDRSAIQRLVRKFDL